MYMTKSPVVFIFIFIIIFLWTTAGIWYQQTLVTDVLFPLLQIFKFSSTNKIFLQCNISSKNKQYTQVNYTVILKQHNNYNKQYTQVNYTVILKQHNNYNKQYTQVNYTVILKQHNIIVRSVAYLLWYNKYATDKVWH